MSQNTEKQTPLAKEDEFPAEEDQNPAKFSTYLSSPIVTVTVSDRVVGSGRTFYLHSRLLISVSLYFEAALKKSQFVEGQKRQVNLEDVDPNIFGLFVEWLYRDGWSEYALNSQLHETKIYLLARAYILGERLLCTDMQNAAADLIYYNLTNYGDGYFDTAVCDLLEIVEMGIGTPDDPLADRILWLAVQRLQRLQKHDWFECLMREHQNLAIELCMRAGDKRQSGGWDPRKRFKKEGMY